MTLTEQIDAFIAGADWRIEDEPDLVPRPEAETLDAIALREMPWRMALADRRAKETPCA